MKTLTVHIKDEQRAKEILAILKLAKRNKELKAELAYEKYKQEKNKN